MKRGTRKSQTGRRERPIEDLGVTGPSLHFGLNAPPSAAQASVPGWTSESVLRSRDQGLAKSYST